MALCFIAGLIGVDRHSGPMRRSSISLSHVRIPISLHCFLKEFHRSNLVPLLRDIGFQDFAFVVDSAPKIMAFSPELDEHLIQMPASLGATSLRFRSAFRDLVSKVFAEAVDTEAYSFTTDINAMRVEQVPDITK